MSAVVVCAAFAAALWVLPGTVRMPVPEVLSPRLAPSTEEQAPGPRGSTHQRDLRGAERAGPVPMRTRLLAGSCLVLVGHLALGAGVGTVVGVVAAAGVGVWLSRQEPPASVRRRARLAADLPHAVDLLAALLRAGQAPAAAAGLVGRTVEGPAGETLAAVHRRAGAGLDAYAVWRPLAEQEATALLGSAMLRSLESGARVVDVVDRVAEELRREARAAASAHAKAVGVRATLPLAACFLPSLLCIGVVPFVASLVVPLLSGI